MLLWLRVRLFLCCWECYMLLLLLLLLCCFRCFFVVVVLTCQYFIIKTWLRNFLYVIVIEIEIVFMFLSCWECYMLLLLLLFSCYDLEMFYFYMWLNKVLNVTCCCDWEVRLGLRLFFCFYVVENVICYCCCYCFVIVT